MVADLNHIEPRHVAIDTRLGQWARWVKVRQAGAATAPMFRMYQSKARQWEADPHIHIALNEQECLQTEKAVSTLPAGHRTALRWYYAFPWVPMAAVRTELGVSRAGLADMLHAARDMLCTKLRKG